MVDQYIGHLTTNWMKPENYSMQNNDFLVYVKSGHNPLDNQMCVCVCVHFLILKNFFFCTFNIFLRASS